MRYTLQIQIGPRTWSALQEADTVSALKTYAQNMGAQYRVIDHRRDRVARLDVARSWCRIEGGWMDRERLDALEGICDRLGYDPNTGFVTLERGRIGFSFGKPGEIRALARLATEAGYALTAGLRRAAKEVW